VIIRTHAQQGTPSLCTTGFQERLKLTTSRTNHSFVAFPQQHTYKQDKTL